MWVDKKFCSITRGSSDGWNPEGKQIFIKLVEKVEKL